MPLAFPAEGILSCSFQRTGALISASVITCALRVVLALPRRSDETVGAQCQTQCRQAGSCKRDRRRVDMVRPTTTAITKVRPIAASMITLGRCRHGKHRKDGG